MAKQLSGYVSPEGFTPSAAYARIGQLTSVRRGNPHLRVFLDIYRDQSAREADESHVIETRQFVVRDYGELSPPLPLLTQYLCVDADGSKEILDNLVSAVYQALAVHPDALALFANSIDV